jgi:hypothetical protein
MTEASLPGLVAAVRSYHASTAACEEVTVLRRAGLRRLAGGHNSGVYAASLHRQRLRLKLPVVDEHGRGDRQWQALQLLAAHLPGLAPTPLWYDPNPSQSVVVMQLLPGRHLGGRRLDRRQLAALAELHIQLQAITPAPTSLPLPTAVGQPVVLLQRVRSFWEAVRPDPDLPWQSQAARWWQDWSAGPDPAVLLAPTPPRLAAATPAWPTACGTGSGYRSWTSSMPAGATGRWNWPTWSNTRRRATPRPPAGLVCGPL